MNTVRIGSVCEKGNHVQWDCEDGGCGSHIFADLVISVVEHRRGRDGHVTRSQLEDIAGEITRALEVHFKAEGTAP